MPSVNLTDFELQKSENQNLSFEYLEGLLKEQDMVLDEDTMIDFGIKYEDYFTNLAHWISDQNDKCTIIAVFSDVVRSSSLKRIVLHGSVLKQMNDALDHITKHNRISFRIKNMKRVETSVFPPDAIRECLENAFIHADYSSEVMMMFSVYPDRIEFVSPGGMLTQFDMNDLACGVSSLRNKTLSRLMVSLKYSAMAGTGMPIIMNSYRKYHSKPTIYSSATIFKIQLPAISESEDSDSIEEYLSMHREFSRTDFQDALCLNKSAAVNQLSTLLQSGRIEKLGNGPSTHYKVK